MNEPQSNEDAEHLPDGPTLTSYELTLLPDRGDGTYEMVPLPHPVSPPGLTDDEIEPPIERHDPFAWMRGARWMDRKLSPSGRAAVLLRRDLKAFPVIDGRDPNHANLDAIVKRTVDYIVPIIRREQATDYVYEELEKRRADRIAKKREATIQAAPNVDPNIVRVGTLLAEARDVEVAQVPVPTPAPRVDSPSAATSAKSSEGTPVILPNGKTVPNEYAPSDVLMSPFADLDHVAAAGRAAFRDGLVNWLKNPLKVEEAIEYGIELIRKDLAQGGRLDYQRLLIPDTVPDYLQLPQFRDVSNFNVGLFMQQAGFPHWLTMVIAGKYAEKYSSNHRPDQRDGLDPRTRAWIERGYEAGESGLFTPAPAGDPSRSKR